MMNLLTVGSKSSLWRATALGNAESCCKSKDGDYEQQARLPGGELIFMFVEMQEVEIPLQRTGISMLMSEKNSSDALPISDEL